MASRRQPWVVLGIAAGLLLLLAVPLAYLVYLQSRFNSAIAAYRIAGEPMSEAEFGWADLADDDNIAAGLIALAQRSVAALTAEESQWIDRLWDRSASTNPDPAAKSDEPLTDSQREAAQGAVLRVVPSVDAIHEVLQRQGVRWPVFSDPTLHVTQLGEVRRLARLLADDARIAAERGDAERFLIRVEQIHRIGIALGTRTSLIGHLSGAGLQMHAADLVLGHPLDLTPAATRQLIDMLTAEPGRSERITTVMRVERVIVADQLLAGYPPGTGVMARVAQTLVLRDGPLALEQMEATRAALLAETAREADAQAADFAARAAAMVTSLASPRVPQTVLNSDRRLRTDQRLAAVALAARAYTAAHGRNPAAWSDLVPFGLPLKLVDPFDPDDSPLRWNSDTGVIYSVGLNREDDGGEITTPLRRVGTPTPWDFADRGLRVPAGNDPPPGQ